LSLRENTIKYLHCVSTLVKCTLVKRTFGTRVLRYVQRLEIFCGREALYLC